ncbi:TORTIFOLIA1-like protein 3, partial [Clarias magur]
SPVGVSEAFRIRRTKCWNCCITRHKSIMTASFWKAHTEEALCRIDLYRLKR